MDKLISVIIPCYNSEKFIRKCLDSVLAQTYRNLEVIVIDDGSEDNTAVILDEYAQSDKRVVVLRQTNAGAGAATNTGIEMAQGELMAFVDHDDWLESVMYERLFTAMVDADADMAVCNFNLVYGGSVKACYSNTNSHDATVDVYDDVYGYFARYCACSKPNNYIWSRLYKASIIRNSEIRFENLRLGADTLFNFKLLPLIKRVSFISDGLYNYVQQSASAVHTAAVISNLAVVYADGFDALADYYSAKGFAEFLEVLPIHAFTRLRSVFFYSRLAGMSEEAIAERVNSGFAGRKIYDYLTGLV